MATMKITYGSVGQIYVSKEQNHNVIDGDSRKVIIEKYDQMIPANLVNDFTNAGVNNKTKLVQTAILLLGEYQQPITKHGVRALVNSVGKDISEPLVRIVAKRMGLNHFRMHNTVYYSRWLV